MTYSASVYKYFSTYYKDKYEIRIVDGQRFWIVVEDVAKAIDYFDLVYFAQSRIDEAHQGVFNFKGDRGIKTYLVISPEGLAIALHLLGNQSATNFGQWLGNLFKEIEQKERELAEEDGLISIDGAASQLGQVISDLSDRLAILTQKLEEAESRSILQEKRILCLEQRLTDKLEEKLVKRIELIGENVCELIDNCTESNNIVDNVLFLHEQQIARLDRKLAEFDGNED